MNTLTFLVLFQQLHFWLVVSAGAPGHSRERFALRGVRREPAAQRTQRALVHASQSHRRGAGPRPRRQRHLRPNADHGLPGAEFQWWWDKVKALPQNQNPSFHLNWFNFPAYFSAHRIFLSVLASLVCRFCWFHVLFRLNFPFPFFVCTDPW